MPVDIDGAGGTLRIALFVTCVADAMFPDAASATLSLLERLGHEVVVPDAQGCCGQMHLNSGFTAQGASLAARFIETFSEFDAVVAPSSSCVGAVRDLYPKLLGRSDPVIERTVELSELLVHRLGVEDVGARFPHRVVYHPSCHSLRVTRVGDAPLRLLRNVRELELLELDGDRECCGFGGTFAIKNADTSSAMLADKCRSVEASGAEICTALDGSCLLQIGGGLSRRGSSCRVLHLAEILVSQ
jgi:L-lactate dehydrogenase complex protein LldE